MTARSVIYTGQLQGQQVFHRFTPLDKVAEPIGNTRGRPIIRATSSQADTIHMNSVRVPAVAGAFYPGTSDALRSQLLAMLASAGRADARRPKALIAPHAGYIYSGPIAASAYAHLAPHRNDYARVVLLGPAHRVRLRGLALPASTSFATPRGSIEPALGR